MIARTLVSDVFAAATGGIHRGYYSRVLGAFPENPPTDSRRTRGDQTVYPKSHPAQETDTHRSSSLYGAGAGACGGGFAAVLSGLWRKLVSCARRLDINLHKLRKIT